MKFSKFEDDEVIEYRVSQGNTVDFPLIVITKQLPCIVRLAKRVVALNLHDITKAIDSILGIPE